MTFDLDKIDKILYHFKCLDGLSCAVILYKYYLEKKLKLPTFIGIPAGDKNINYNEYKDKNILIADVSFNREQTINLKKVCNSLLIVDHHISNYKILKDLDYAKFDLNHSASYLTYTLFYPNKKIPSFILKIEDVDIQNKNPHFENSNEFYLSVQVQYQNVMDIQKGGLDKWLKLFDENFVEELTSQGGCFRQYQQYLISLNNKFYKKAIFINQPTLKVIVFKDTHIVGLSSDLLHSIEDECDIACLYKYMENKQSYLVMLRTNKDNLNLVELFGEYGFAGHVRAVSAQIKDINSILKFN
jgi:hypothetical protein